MAISGQYQFHAGTAAAFAAAKEADTIVAQDLYFLTDTKELFVGEVKYCNPVEFVTEDPATGVVGVLYVNTVSHKITAYNGTAMVEVAPAVVSTFTGAADGAVANVKAIKDYVAGQVTTLGNPVKDVAYDNATQKITLTYNNDTTKELLLKDIITNVAYDGKTGKFTFTRANNAEALEISTPVENFLANAEIDEKSHILTLTLEGGQKVTVDLTTLVDVYTVDDTATVDMTMDNGKITADVKVSQEAGNAVVAKTDGIFVAIPKDYIQSVEGGKAVDLAVDAAGKLTAEAKKSATEGNKVQIADDGLFVAADYIGAIDDTATIDLDVTGAKLTGTVKVSKEENNAIVAKADGLHVDITAKADKTYVDTELAKKQDNLTADQLKAVNSGIDTDKVTAYEAHIADAAKHITAEERTKWNAKQDALTEAQLAAVNSGITAAKVTAYDGLDAAKADKATTLAGYNIGDAYTKAEVDANLSWKTI